MKYFLILATALCTCLSSCIVNPDDQGFNTEYSSIDSLIESINTQLYNETLDSLYDETYNDIVEYIKSHEGYLSTPYRCPAGHLTIGYGHVLQGDDSYSYLTKEQATKLLKSDLNKAIKSAERNCSKLNKLQRLAVAHFTYSLGVGRYLRSSLKSKIDNNEDLESIQTEWLKYSKYRTPKGKVVFSKLAHSIRSYEFEIFKQGHELKESYRVPRYASL